MAMVFVTGGARSGKSKVAERLAASRGGAVTVVVFGDAHADAEMGRRIERHRATRPEGWTTFEASDSLSWRSAADDGTLVVECLGTLLSLVMAEVAEKPGMAGDSEEVAQGYEEAVETRLGEALGWLETRRGDTVVVSNEVGGGVVPAYPSGRVFRDVLGRANRRLADAADAAFLVVAGRCIRLDGLPRDVAWPHEEEGAP